MAMLYLKRLRELTGLRTKTNRSALRGSLKSAIQNPSAVQSLRTLYTVGSSGTPSRKRKHL